MLWGNSTLFNTEDDAAATATLRLSEAVIWIRETIAMCWIHKIVAVSILSMVLFGCGHRKQPVPFANASSSGQSLMDALWGRSDAPQTLLIYDDTTASAAGQGASGMWKEIMMQVGRFLSSAAPGSKLEVYVTGPEVGRPPLVLEKEIRKMRPRDRRETIEQAVQQVQKLENDIRRNTPHLPYSCILEDVYRLAVRAASLNAAEHGRSQLIVCTDLQQYSKMLKIGEILRGDTERLAGRVLKTMPPLAVPPEAVTFIYFPGKPGPQPLSAGEEEKLKLFFRRVVSRWGCPDCKIMEPRNL